MRDSSLEGTRLQDAPHTVGAEQTPTGAETALPVTRRDALMRLGRWATGATILAATIETAGCGGGSTAAVPITIPNITSTPIPSLTPTPPVVDSRAAGKVTVNPKPTAFTNDNGSAVAYLGGVTGTNQIISLYYGVLGTNGLAARITESFTFTDVESQGTRVLYNNDGLPVTVRHEANGAFLTLLWETNRVTIKLYQPNGAFIGAAIVTTSAGRAATINDFTVTPLGVTPVTGTFVGSLTGLTDAVVTLTIGGGTAGRAQHVGTVNRAALQDSAATHRYFTGNTTRQTTTTTTTPPLVTGGPDPNALVPALTALAAAGAKATALPIAATLLAALQDSVATDSTNTLLPALLTRVLAGGSPTPPFIGSGAPLTGGLVAALTLATSANALLARIQKSNDPVSSGDLFASTENPVADGYISPITFTTPSGRGDTTRVAGVVSAREFGSIPVTGSVDNTNVVTLTGTKTDGTAIRLTGTIADNKITNGQWATTNTGATRQQGGASGSWNANQQPLGQCQTQQNSGNQGIFTNTYDLGRTCGTFPFSYEAYTIPDQFQVFYEGNTLLDTGSISHGTTVNLRLGGSTSFITVVVTANLDGTAWNYTVGCPTGN